MADNEVVKGLKKRKAEETSYFWGYFISIISIMDGIFILATENFLGNRLDAYLLGVGDNIFGWALVILGLAKILGILADSKKMRLVGVVGLSVVWGMLFAVSLLFSFGIGYPSNAFISNGAMLGATFRVAYKGVFH